MMPDFDMWGPAQAGSRLAEQDAIKRFMGLAQAQENLAQARERQAKVDAMRKEEAALAKIVAPTKSGTLSEALTDVSRQMMDLGQYGKAADMAVKATQIYQNETQAAAAEALEGKRRAEQGIALFEQAAGLFRSAQSEQDWASANMMFSQMFPKAKNPFAGMPYTPENARLAGQALLSEKDRLKADEEKTRTDILRKNQESLAALREARIKRLRDQTANDAERERRLAKSGGKTGRNTPVGSPSKQDIIAAGQLLDSKLEFKLEDEDARVAAYDVAAEAKALMKARPGLSAKEAREQAVATIIKSGDLETVSKVFGRNRSRYTGGGRSPETAVPVKEGMTFKPGKYYVNSQGVTARFNGKGFEPVESTDTMDEE